MRVVLESSDGKKRERFDLPLSKTEERNLFRAIAENRNNVAYWNIGMAIIQWVRDNWA